MIVSAHDGSQAKLTEVSSKTCLLDLLEQERPNNILLVYDQDAYHAGPYNPEQVIEPQFQTYLDRRGYNADHLIKITGFHTYPTAEYIRQVIEQIQVHRIDLVIGIGGGMVMDIAKAASILATQPEAPEVYITGKVVPSPRRIRLMLIPTTAGTGAEVTQFSVVYIDKIKYSLAHPSLGADHALLVPEFTYALPKAVTATSGCDAIAQAIEAFWSVNATPESHQYSAQALACLLPHIVEAVHRPTEENRRAMMLGACYAGMAINIAKTTWAHAASYWLTANKDISHGHAVMLTLPYLFPLIDEANEQTVRKTAALTVGLLRERMSSLYHMLGVSDGREARDLLHRIMGDCGLERHIDRLDVNPSEFEDIVDAVNPDRMKNMPINISRETALNIMYQASRT
ncbi:MAG TPA: iron-containing alcohol dehydrogenase [candidate division Zixibacteria bacterium]|nr:iron-containing alcohol dehydrogenase [candidate division Zixibacteria bacterium]